MYILFSGRLDQDEMMTGIHRTEVQQKYP